MLIEKIGYSYNDVTLVPSEISNVSSRSECNPFVINLDAPVRYAYLPIFTAPMASVVNFENYETFIDNGIAPIMPRNISLDVRKDLMNDEQWVALSLKEFEDLFIENASSNKKEAFYFICVDIANGHMKSLYDKCIIAKQKAEEFGYKLTIMTGNIANPKTYEWICKNATYKTNDNKKKCAIDYIRVGIGGGSGCITTSNVSAHYPQASLINKCYNIKQQLLLETITEHGMTSHKYNKEILPKIVADGGIRNYDNVIKALALGADYVMIGSLFAQCIESAGSKVQKDDSRKLPSLYKYDNFRIDNKGYVYGYYIEEFIKESIKPWEECLVNSPDKEHAKSQYDKQLKFLKEEKCIGQLCVKFFGMASADGQKSISGKKTKTAEGITKWLPVKYTLKGWVENMVSYLRSAMSYTDCKTLDEFIGTPDLIINSISEINAVNK